MRSACVAVELSERHELVTQALNLGTASLEELFLASEIFDDVLGGACTLAEHGDLCTRKF